MDNNVDQSPFSLTFFPSTTRTALRISMTAERLNPISGTAESPKVLYVAPTADWINYSRQFQKANTMKPEEVGALDALIFRRETSSTKIVCDELFLLNIGFVRREAAVSQSSLIKRVLQALQQV